MPLSNYHTHTFRCKHAEGDFADYVKEALKQSLDTLGFSDHMPHPKKTWETVRMGLEELSEYCKSFQKTRFNFPAVNLFLGLECEYEENLDNFYKKTLLEEYQIEYLICGMHWVVEGERLLYVGKELNKVSHLHAYVRSLALAMETRLFAFIAHPDLYFGSFLEWDENTKAAAKEILSLAERTASLLEINGLGFKKEAVKASGGLRPPYPLTEFWELAAEYNVKVIVNSDAHSPYEVADLDRGLALAKAFDLKLGEPLIKKRPAPGPTVLKGAGC